MDEYNLVFTIPGNPNISVSRERSESKRIQNK